MLSITFFIYLISIYFVLFVSFCIYRIYCHPLSGFPGPKFFHWSNIPWCWILINGNLHTKTQEWHRQYGPVVRVGPNSLSFSTIKSMEDIYGSRPSKASFPKNNFYESLSLNFWNKDLRSLLTQRDPKKHLEARKIFRPVFSRHALVGQEAILKKHAFQLVERFTERAESSTNHTGIINLAYWYALTAFDNIGNLAFGKTFGCLETGRMHFWVQYIFGHFRLTVFVESLNRLGILKPTTLMMIMHLMPEYMRGSSKNVKAYTEETIDEHRDMSKPGAKERGDFLTTLEAQRHRFSRDEFLAHFASVAMAGSETTSSALSGITYLLLKNPEPYEKLKAEIRGMFESPEEINCAKLENCSYLHACINEGLRMYPPVPFGGVRQSPVPGATVDGTFVPQGTEVSCSPWTYSYMSNYFPEPYTFKPERWLGEGDGSITKASQPFGYGDRNCIGRELANLELRMVLAHVIWNFDQELVDQKTDWIAGGRNYIMWRNTILDVKTKKRAI